MNSLPFIGAVITTLTVLAHAQTPQGVVPFTVAGRASPGAVSVLVAPKTTDDQLITLINAFRTARIKGTLGQTIPPTTPKAPKGPFTVVAIFVLSDPAAGNSPMLDMFVNPKTRGISDNEKEFGKRILAYYHYTALGAPGDQEEGTLGYRDEGFLYTNRYKKLF
jgi:hypothetical protein